MLVSLIDSLKCGICKSNRAVSLVLMLLSLIFSGASYSATLTPAQYTTLNGILNTHLNYFLSTAAVTSYGLPLSAYKVGDRARFGYSNPTEWGYLLQAYIAAAERGKISKSEAASRITTTLNTVKTLQDNNLQVYHGGLFYPYYKVTDSLGNDVFPFHDSSLSIPSMDNSMLYMSLVIVDGWALDNNFASLSSQARAIYSKMNFSPFIYTESSTGNKIEALVVNASTNARAGKCDVYANEGGLTTMIAYFSGSVDFATYNALTSAQLRGPATWNGITVQEADWFNPMFTWGVRSLAGVPVTGTPYSTASLVPSYRGHLTYEEKFGIAYPALSDAMSQGWVQNYFLPNISRQFSPVTNSVPHAFFIPLNVLADLEQATLNTTITKITELMSDTAGYYFGTGSAYPFGFVVATSPRKDDISYLGVVPIDGKNIFETLSEAFIALSTFNALQQQDNSKDFSYFMTKSPSMVDHMKTVQAYLYPTYQPTLTVTNSNTVGGTVTSDSGGINCGSTCSQNYAIGTLVTLTAAANSGYVAGWGGGCTSYTVSGDCLVTLIAAKNVTANFDHALTVINLNPANGTVTSDTGGIACGATCSANFATGTPVKLTAIPVTGYQFSGWGGSCSGYGNGCPLTMDTDKSATANFEVFKRRRPSWKRGLLSQ